MRFQFKRVARASALLIFTLTFFTHNEVALCQDVQLWLDGFIYKELGKTIVYEGNAGYKSQLGADVWSDALICNTLSWQALKWFALDGGLEFHNAWDPVDPNMTELRPWLGQKFTIVQFIRAIHLDKPYFYVRYDQRFLWYPEDATFDSKSRMRFSLGGRFLLNNITLEERTFYIPFYIEYFYNQNGDAYEKYANQNRAVIGFGYAFNEKWRTELVYYAQRSRNTYEEEFVRSDMVFQFQLKYFLK